MRLNSKLVLVFSAMLGSFWSSAQIIRVHVINADTGISVSRKKVQITSALESHGKPTHLVQVHPKIDLKTLKDGSISFDLSQLGAPPPEKLLISIAEGNWTQCSPLSVSTATVLESGIIEENFCKSKATDGHTYSARPGEVMIFTRHISFGEKLRRFPE